MKRNRIRTRFHCPCKASDTAKSMKRNRGPSRFGKGAPGEHCLDSEALGGSCGRSDRRLLRSGRSMALVVRTIGGPHSRGDCRHMRSEQSAALAQGAMDGFAVIAIDGFYSRGDRRPLCVGAIDGHCSRSYQANYIPAARYN